MNIDEGIIKYYNTYQSIKSTAAKFNLSETCVRKILVTHHIIETDFTIEILEMFNSGMSCKDIAKRLGCSKSKVNANLPYIKGRYNSETPSVNAERIRKCRQKKK